MKPIRFNQVLHLEFSTNSGYLSENHEVIDRHYSLKALQVMNNGLGGTLIIWDRMFGTFAEEQEEVVYGLTHNIDTFNAWTVQTHQFSHMLRQFCSVPGWGNKIKVLFYGPGWSVGKPRLGDPNDIPDVHAPVLKHQSTISLNIKILVTVLFANCVILALALLDRTSPMSPLDNAVQLPFQLSVIAIISAFIFCAGLVFDSHPAAPYFLYGLALVNCVGYGSINWTSSSDMFAAIMPLSPTGLVSLFFLLLPPFLNIFSFLIDGLYCG
jgi:hypothetical protein